MNRRINVERRLVKHVKIGEAASHDGGTQRSDTSVGVVAARQCDGLVPTSLQRADRGPPVIRTCMVSFFVAVCVVVFETAVDESQPSKTYYARRYTLEVSLVWEA